MEPCTTVFFCGTWMDRLLGPIVTKHLIDHFPKPIVKTLPHLGIDDCMTTYRYLSEWLDETISPDKEYVFAGHSQGGLYACMAAASRPNVKRVITISTPHHGTTMANHSPNVGRIGRGIRDMRPGTQFMRDYEAMMPLVNERLMSIYFHHDLLVTPYNSAHVVGAWNCMIAKDNEAYKKTFPHHLGEVMFLQGNPNHISGMLADVVRQALRMTDDDTHWVA